MELTTCDFEQLTTVIAIGSVPKDSGTFTFYRTLREGLSQYGMEVKCVSVGASDAALCEEAFKDDGCVTLAAAESNIKKQSQAFADWCVKSGVDIVIGLNSVAILSSLQHLPVSIKIISRCATVFDHGYQITMSGYERLSKIVAVNPRQVSELVDCYGATQDRIVLIPNGTDINRFKSAASIPRGQSGALRLGYLGRIHEQKGALFLPKILELLENRRVPFTLTIGGKGVHEGILKRKLAKYLIKDQVKFVGTVKPEDVPDFLEDIDVFLFLSLFEGSPNALLESMAAGCVPVAWNLLGITNHIVENGHSGILIEEGDCESVADAVVDLSIRRERLREISMTACETAKSYFSKKRMIDDYLELFRCVVTEQPNVEKVRPWAEFRTNEAFRKPFWRALIPQQLKNVVKRVFFFLRMSKRTA